MSIADLLGYLRRRENPAVAPVRRALATLFRAEMPTGRVHKLLASERFFRRLILRHVARATYHQPIFRTLCARAGERLLLDPGTGIPVVYGIDLELGGGVHLSGRATFAGAHRTDGKRPRLVIGDDSYLGHRLMITADSEVIIGKHVHIADDVYLCGYDAHPLDPIARRTEPGPVDYSGGGRILIDDDAWICQGVFVKKGIHIGRGAVAGAHAVVVSDVPDFAIVAGNPARVVGSTLTSSTSPPFAIAR